MTNPVERMLPRPSASVAFALFAVLCVFVGHTLLFSSYVNDDAYITFRYSRFLALGRGPYFNGGEHVEGYTNFLLMVLMAPVIALFGANAAPAIAKIVGVASATASLVVAYALSRRLALEDPRLRGFADHAGLLAAAILAVSPSLAVNSMSGLETTLFGALLAAGTWFGTESVVCGKWKGAGVAFAAAALTRPEGAMVFAAYAVAQAASVWWRALAFDEDQARKAARRATTGQMIPDAVIVAVTVAGHVAFRMVAYDGEILPNTYFAKMGGALNSGPPGLYVYHGLAVAFGGVIGLGISVAGMLLTPSHLYLAMPALAVVAAGAAEPFVTGPDWMYAWRLTAPYLPVAASLVALAWCRAFGSFKTVTGRSSSKCSRLNE